MDLASCGVKSLNLSSVFQIYFGAGLTILCSEIPHERQAQKNVLNFMCYKFKHDPAPLLPLYLSTDLKFIFLKYILL